MSANSTLVEPAFRSHPPFTATLGPEVADLCELVGFAPDPEQRLALDVIFALEGRTSAAFEAAVVCSRQNLKTGLFKQCALGWLFITDQRLVVWSAHEFGTAKEAFRDVAELVDGSDWLRRRVKNIYRGNGDEAVELLTGQRLIFKARTKVGGRGLTGDKVVLDEAFALQPVHMGALLPTLSARPDPQVLYGSSAGLVDSEVLRGIRDRGRAGDDGRLAYLEWCDDLPGECGEPACDHRLEAVGCRLDDERRWARSNPAMGRRISVEYIRDERRALGSIPQEFARERLGWWDEPGVTDLVIAAETWSSLTDARSQALDPVAFALDASRDRQWWTIAVSGRRLDGLWHVEVVQVLRGPSKVVETVRSLVGRWANVGVEVDPSGMAASLLPELSQAGVPLTTPSRRECAAACARMLDTVEEQALRVVPHPALDMAAAAARRRFIGEVWLWDRDTGADVSALMAATLALHAAQTRAALDVSESIW